MVTKPDNTLPVDPLSSLKEILEPWLREVLHQELEKVINNGQSGDRLLTADQTLTPYLTIKEAACLSRLAPSTIRLYIRKRELKAHQVGSRVIIKRADLEQFVEGHPIEIAPD